MFPALPAQKVLSLFNQSRTTLLQSNFHLWSISKSVVELMKQSFKLKMVAGLPVCHCFPGFLPSFSPIPSEQSWLPEARAMPSMLLWSEDLRRLKNELCQWLLQVPFALVLCQSGRLGELCDVLFSKPSLHLFTSLASKLTGVFYILKTGLFKRLNTTFDIWFYSPTGLQPAIPLDCVPQWLTLVPKLKGLLHKETCCFKSPWLYGGWFKAWQSLIEKRKLLLQEWRENGVPQSPPNQVAWIENLNAAAALLQLSPLPFFAYITGRKTISDTDISIKTTCVYLICCAQNKKSMWVKLGGKQAPGPQYRGFLNMPGDLYW